jgi:hypothetical protein
MCKNFPNHCFALSLGFCEIVHGGFVLSYKDRFLKSALLARKKQKTILPEEQNISFDKVFTSPHHVQVFSDSLFCFVTRVL